jgi:hypothetical protein
LARARPDETSASRQLTLDDWEQMLNGAPKPPAESSGEPAAVTVLAEALAPRLAEELSSRIPRATITEGAPASRLLTLDELVAELPQAKRPQTWKRWLYERTRRDEIPGCVKLGGMLFFERETALAWLRAGAVAR